MDAAFGKPDVETLGRPRPKKSGFAVAKKPRSAQRAAAYAGQQNKKQQGNIKQQLLLQSQEYFLVLEPRSFGRCCRTSPSGKTF